MKNGTGLRLSTENTRTKILRLLLLSEHSAIDLAGELNINESAVRKHLDLLEKRGLVAFEFKKIGMGRPKKLYRMTAKGHKTFPNMSDLLLRFLTEEIHDKFDTEELKKLSDSLAQEITEEVIGDDIDDIVKRFNDLGLYCSLEKKNEEHIITYRNCVFRDVSPDFAAWMCRVHRKVLKNILGDIVVKQEKSILAGDPYCKQTITIHRGR